ncbi:MAG: glycoside hydrolase family 16 protein [Lacipirellulaceae bacterium]
MLPLRKNFRPCCAVWSVLLLFSATPAVAQIAPEGWTLTWNDEFNGTQLDTTKWDPIFWNTPFNNERQAYRPDRATVSGGNLVLTADDTPNGGKQYTSGKVESVYAQQHGRWEVRAKLPSTQGTWPAIWLLPDTNTWPWPSQGEIDIMENRGHQPDIVSSAFHYGPDFFGRQFETEEIHYNGPSAGNYHNDFHIYAVEWDATQIKFFVDDVNYHTITDAQVGGFLSSQTAPMEVNLNVAVGGDFLGGLQPNGSSVWPQEMLVDYVRIFERSTDITPFQNGSFEDGGGSLSSWNLFGNSIPNVLAESEAVLDGSHSLKIFGQFNGGQNFSGAEQGIPVEGGDEISATASSYIRSVDDLINGNVVSMKFDYYSAFGGQFGSADYLGSTAIEIANDATTNDQWFEHVLSDTVPANAVEARLVFLFNQPNQGQGAIHIDDVLFSVVELIDDADGNGDGIIDGLDFLQWQQGNGDFNNDALVNGSDLTVWRQQYGDSSSSSIAAVPEPASWLLILAFSAGCLSRRCSR